MHALVRHGAARYVDANGVLQTGFRGMTVDMPEEEFDRLEALGAVMPADEELTRGGTLMPLPNTASDEELIAWVSVATRDEIAAQIADTPHLADRLLTARDAVKQKLAEQNEILGGVQDAVDEGLELAAKREQAQTQPSPEGAAPEAGGEGDDTKSDGDAGDGGDATNEITDEAIGEVIHGTVAVVSKFLSEHPEQFQRILAAERERAQESGAKPDHVREGVVTAAQAAAAHVAN